MTQFRGFKHISSMIANVQSNDKARSTTFGRDLDLFKAEIQRVLLKRQCSSHCKREAVRNRRNSVY